jgi:hypothetical protein
MGFGTILVLTLMFCIALGVLGLGRGYPLWMIGGALTNAAGLVVALCGAYYSFTSSIRLLWILGLISLAFCYICGENVRNFVNGKEARQRL